MTTTTVKTTLMKAEWFKTYFEHWDNKSEIFLDTDPKLFNHFLNKLSDENYILPNDPNVINVFKYYNCFLDEVKKKTKQGSNMNFHIISFQTKKIIVRFDKINSFDIILTIPMNLIGVESKIIEISLTENKDNKFLTCCYTQLPLFFDIMYNRDENCACYRLREKYLTELKQWAENNNVQINVFYPRSEFSYMSFNE
jgi:hypothetical protein